MMLLLTICRFGTPASWIAKRDSILLCLSHAADVRESSPLTTLTAIVFLLFFFDVHSRCTRRCPGKSLHSLRFCLFN
ncbi:hypothetical protein KCP75_04740 [Salmonella enterica subsp. enterica]|nr:hypothetical protein KCP75_04740 [Salmonella enterica subsp. enterica]